MLSQGRVQDLSDGDSGFSDSSVVSPLSMVSEAATTSSSSAAETRKQKISRTKPNCNKCKNHKVINSLSGHKRYCLYRDCVCELCLLTDERRRVMAAQTRQKRAQVQDEKNGLPLEMRAPVLPPPSSPLALEGGSVSSPKPSSTAQLPFVSDPPPIPAKKRKIEEEPLDAIEAARRLVSDFGVADTVLPFALALLRRVGDYNIVSKMILDIQEALLEKTRLTASFVHDRPPIFAHGPNYVPEAHSNSQAYNSYKPCTDSCGAIPLIHRTRVL